MEKKKQEGDNMVFYGWNQLEFIVGDEDFRSVGGWLWRRWGRKGVMADDDDGGGIDNNIG